MPEFSLVPPKVVNIFQITSLRLDPGPASEDLKAKTCWGSDASGPGAIGLGPFGCLAIPTPRLQT